MCISNTGAPFGVLEVRPQSMSLASAKNDCIMKKRVSISAVPLDSHELRKVCPSKEMKKSLSFGSLAMLKNPLSSVDFLSEKELQKYVDFKGQEPNRVTKQQIKAYAIKYRDFEFDESKLIRPWYREFLEVTQPAHLIAMIAVLYLAFRLFPDSQRSASGSSTLTRLLYVGSISWAFGNQMWMTFVSGLALFFSVPRHVFSQVQTVLFPLYFLINAVLMLIAVITFTRHNPTHLWDAHQTIQGVMLVSCFLVNLLIRLYLAPTLNSLITIKVAIEKEAGLGQEVGSSSPGRLSHCPHYMRLHRAFRRIHLIVAIGNMAALVASSFHMYYLATKLCAMDF